MIEREPHDAIPSHERFQLAAIGIEKSKPFTPDATRKALFDDAGRFASAIARTNSFDSDDPARLVYPDRRWEWAFIGGSASWDSQGYVNTGRRSSFAYIAIGMSPAMVEKSRMPMAPSISTSGPTRPPRGATRRTGSRPREARDGSRFSASTVRPNPSSIRPGSPTISSR
jgi:hypothetical protein